MIAWLRMWCADRFEAAVCAGHMGRADLWARIGTRLVRQTTR